MALITSRPAADEAVAGKLVTERGVYRPGERVHVAGWAHPDRDGSRTGLEYFPAGTEFQLTLFDPDRRPGEWGN